MFDQGIDSYLIFSECNRMYFTKRKISFGCAIIADKSKVFVTDFRYEIFARQSMLDFIVISCNPMDLYSVVAEQLANIGAKTIGYEEETLPVSEFARLSEALAAFKLVPASKIIAARRAIKSVEEIQLIADSQIICQKALTKAAQIIKAGITERELSAEITYQMLSLGADATSFDNIVAFGENSAKPHHSPSNKALVKSDIILVDIGAKANGYCSDMSRTFSIGNVNAELVRIHGIVLEAQSHALAHIRAGMTGHEVDSLCREYIVAHGYGKMFGHGLGHGVGINIHESPRLGVGSTDVLKAGMVVTVEPGIYIEGLGGVRIEDLVVIEENGIRNLTTFSKNINL